MLDTFKKYCHSTMEEIYEASLLPVPKGKYVAYVTLVVIVLLLLLVSVIISVTLIVSAIVIVILYSVSIYSVLFYFVVYVLFLLCVPYLPITYQTNTSRHVPHLHHITFPREATSGGPFERGEVTG